jgi:hypothetical protein
MSRGCSQREVEELVMIIQMIRNNLWDREDLRVVEREEPERISVGQDPSEERGAEVRR